MVAGLALMAGLLASTACGADDARDTGQAAPSSPVETTVPADSPPPEPPPSPVGWQDDVKKAPAAGKVGPDGDCKLPGSFRIPAKWKAQGIPGVVDEGLELRCEVIGEPAGISGSLQVWVATDGSTPRAALEKFVRKSSLDTINLEYREAQFGSASGVEVRYQFGHHATRAFAVGAPGQVVLVIWGGELVLLVGEGGFYEKGLPAYMLARSTYAPAS